MCIGCGSLLNFDEHFMDTCDYVSVCGWMWSNIDKKLSEENDVNGIDLL